MATTDRYKRLKSQYILRKFHQNVDGGKIYEMDWPTIGERQNFGPDKQIVYGDSGFLFTDNLHSAPFTRTKGSDFVNSYTYNDVKDATPDVNKVRLNTKSVFPSFYSYYGSFSKLIEGTVVDIILTFPGRFKYGSIPVNSIYQSYFGGLTLSPIENPFLIDFTRTLYEIDESDNKLRFLNVSWGSYSVDTGDSVENIVSYEVDDVSAPHDMLKKVYVGNSELVVMNGRYYKYDAGSMEYYEVGVEESSNYFVKCGEYIRHKDSYYKWNDDANMYTGITVDEFCPPDVYKNYDITIRTECNEYKLYGYVFYGSLIYFGDMGSAGVVVRPNDEVINEYFSKLTGLSKTMLTRDTNPLYTFSMDTITTNPEGFNVESIRRYTWPSDGYCIQIDTSEYMRFIESIMTLAETHDNEYCDNLWRNMTHESIKNFDNTYEKDNEVHDKGDLAFGSERMCSMLRLMGMEFDELKMYICGITSSIGLTYDGENNMPDSELCVQCENRGVEFYSTIWSDSRYVEIDESEIPEGTIISNYFAVPDVGIENPDYISVGCAESSKGIKYYHRQTENFINNTIDEAFLDGYVGKYDPWIKQNSTGYHYEKMVSEPDVDEDYWTDRNTFDTAPTMGSRFSPKYIRVYSPVGGFLYYEKLSDMENSDYLHSLWYPSLNCSRVTQSSCDIDFTRRLALSASEVMRTKGTAKSIDMVMGMFGIGRSDKASESDYTLEEAYYTSEVKGYDDIFWYYESVDGPESGVSYTLSNTFNVLPLYVNEERSRFPEKIRVDNGVGGYTYYRINGDMTVGNAVVTIYNAIVGTPYYDSKYGGIPLSEAYISGKKCLVPYMSDYFKYKGEIYFQCDGGWLKRSDIDNGIYDYTETVPYVRSVEKCGSLLELDAASMKTGDYVYVKYIADYKDIFGTVPNYVSNYFKLSGSDSSVAGSWVNIPVDGPVVFNNYMPSDDVRYTREDYLNVKFIDGIIGSNIGNNPHSGKGEYDGGKRYTDYMSLPFRYSIDNYEFSDNRLLEMATQFAFYISNERYSELKTWTAVEGYRYEQLENEPVVEDGYWNSINTFDSLPNILYPSLPYIIRISSGDSYLYFQKKTVYPSVDEYRLNSKIVRMTNMLNNQYYKRYFNSVILPYLTQVIPSTTILVLENFDECIENNGIFHCVSVTANDESYGFVSGGGMYAECDFATLTASPSEGYHFVRWVLSCGSELYIDSDETLTDNEFTFKVLGDVCFMAVFEKDCVITYENALDDCGVTVVNNSVVYGRMCINGSDVFTPDSEINLNNYDSVIISQIPSKGYEFEKWTTDGENVFKSLVEDGIIVLDSDGNIIVKDINGVCGASFIAVYIKKKYTVTVSTMCDDCAKDITIDVDSDCNIS